MVSHDTPLSVVDRMALIAKHLRSYRFRWQDEADLQKAVHKALREGPWKVQREHRLSPRDRVDFYVRDPEGATGVAVELKVHGSPTEVARQMWRYASHDAVDGCLLVTTSHRLATGLPDALDGKPARAVVLSGSLL
jgi:alkanesulfonate monooxygenase SsuD/methylene tetrahydromethanopterin reductase-like flavin-dependent oxidoreductase (luciferase family)